MRHWLLLKVGDEVRWPHLKVGDEAVATQAWMWTVEDRVAAWRPGSQALNGVAAEVHGGD